MTTLQALLELILADDGHTVAIGTEMRCFGVIRRRVRVVVEILLHLGSLVRKARGGEDVTRTGGKPWWNVVRRSKKG
jgi:hypothetical protein